MMSKIPGQGSVGVDIVLWVRSRFTITARKCWRVRSEIDVSWVSGWRTSMALKIMQSSIKGRSPARIGIMGFSARKGAVQRGRDQQEREDGARDFRDFGFGAGGHRYSDIGESLGLGQINPVIAVDGGQGVIAFEELHETGTEVAGVGVSAWVGG